MRILSPAFLLAPHLLLLLVLYIASIRAQGYGGSWIDVPPPQAPPFQRPVDVLTDVINELGVRILQEYGETRNGGNVAFSPTGIGFVLAALYEGSAGPGNEQISHVLGLPRDRDITRIGLRDIHRRLRSYLSPDGFLGGLTLNRENTKLRAQYEDVLKFIGFDLPFGDDGANATDSSTSVPETTPESVTTLSSSAPDSSSLTTTEAPESIAASTPSTEESASTVSSRVSEDARTTTQIPGEVGETSTKAPTEETATTTSPEETTTVKSDNDSVESVSNAEISELPSTTKVAEVEEQTSSTTETYDTEKDSVPGNAIPTTTTESATTVREISSRSTEASSTISSIEQSTEPLPLSSVDSTTVETMVEVPTTVTAKSEIPETTMTSVAEVAETPKPGSTTLKPEDVVSVETTTSMISGSSTTTESTTTLSLDEGESKVEVLNTSESESEMESSSSDPEESREELTTTSTERISTSEPEETSSNEVVSDLTTVRIDTTTLYQADETETIASVNSINSESENLVESTTTSSSFGTGAPVRRRIRKAGVTDPVVRTLLDAGSARPEIKKNENDGAKNRGTRSPRGYFSNFPDFPSFPVYPDFPGYPEETSWTRKFGGWRVHSPKTKTDEGSQDSSELTFLVNGEEATAVSAATYTVVLPFAFLPNLQALALEFPLDDPRYNILLLLPTDRDGTRRLARDLGNVSLRELRKELQPAWVRAMIPSFMLKGFVTLTPLLQRLGIRDVFEPREADLSPMTEEDGIYARDVQQSIGVNIRNYMKPDRTHSRNGLFERAGPVSFIAEHPFLFFIIDAETGVSLIAGRIENPLNSRIL